MKEIALTRGFVALVDDEDFERVNKFKWTAHKQRTINKYYADRRDNVRMHRFIMNPPDGYEIDHIDGNGLNNQKSNLRICTRRQNCMNRKKISPVTRKTTSTFKGVYLFKESGKWRAQIKHNGKRLHLGLFDRETDAATAYNEAAERLYGNFSNTNTIRN